MAHNQAESIAESAPVGIGVIGCGHWGPNHVRVFRSLDGADLVAASDLEAKRLAKLRRAFPGVATTSDYRELLGDSRIAAVVVATPTVTHFPIVREALKAGKHVLVEKPLATSPSECRQLVALAKRVGKRLLVGHVFLFNSGIRYIRQALTKGELGRVLYLHASRLNLGPIRDDVDVSMDLASHDLSIFRYLLDAHPLEVSARGGCFLRPRLQDVAFISLLYPGNVLANIHVSWLDPRKVRQITIVGDSKMLLWDDLAGTDPVTIYDKGVMREPYYRDFGEFQLVTKEGDLRIPRVPAEEPLRAQAEHFLEVLRSGEASVLDADHGARIVDTLQGIHRSMSHGGRPVKLPA